MVFSGGSGEPVSFSPMESPMNLAELRSYCGSLLSYEPTSDEYNTQLEVVLNDSQKSVLTDRIWPFCEKEADIVVQTDVTLASLGVVNGSATVTSAGLFSVSSNVVLPGSNYDGATIEIQGTQYEIAWVETTNTMYLKTDFIGTTGTYAGIVRWRSIYLHPDTASVLSVLNTANGAPVQQGATSKFTSEAIGLDPRNLGTPEFYMPAGSRRVPAPRAVNGLTLTTPGAGRGVRTITLYMVNVWAPNAGFVSMYRNDCSGGFESALSAPLVVVLGDTQEITLVPETIPNNSGLYRRYYMTCAALGIKAPVRVRNTTNPGTNRDTIAPTGTITITADTQVSTLSTQTFQERSIRYQPSNGVYQSIQLYPHPSGDNAMRIRRAFNPSPMIEDTDVPLIPEAYALIIAYAALEVLCLKHGDKALSVMYARKKKDMYDQMAARYLVKVSQRLVRGEGLASPYAGQIHGPVTFTP